MTETNDPQEGQVWEHTNGDRRRVGEVFTRTARHFTTVKWRRLDQKPGKINGSCNLETWHRWVAGATPRE